MPRHKHADVMIAYANDTSSQIESRHPDNSYWSLVSDPCWDVYMEYRIKPPEPKKVEMWQWIVVQDEGCAPTITGGFYESEVQLRECFAHSKSMARMTVVGKAEWSRIEVEQP
jgi:hypothetical protein